MRTTGRLNELLIDANFDADTPVTQLLRDPTRGNAVKLYPAEWHNIVKLRWKVNGCDTKFRKYFKIYNIVLEIQIRRYISAQWYVHSFS